jgi:hypothetical protein
LGITERSKCKGAAGNKERGSVSNVGFLTGEEHDVAAHHEGSANDEEDIAAVDLPAEERDEDGKEGADYLKWPEPVLSAEENSACRRQGDNTNAEVVLEVEQAREI